MEHTYPFNKETYKAFSNNSIQNIAEKSMFKTNNYTNEQENYNFSEAKK